MDQNRNSERSNEGASGSRECPQAPNPQSQPSLVVDIDVEPPRQNHIHHYRCPPSDASRPAVHHYHHQHCSGQPCPTASTPETATDRAEATVQDLQTSLVEITREALNYAERGDRRLISIGRSAVNIVRSTAESIEGLRRDIHNLRFSTTPPRRSQESPDQPYQPPHRRNNSNGRGGWSEWEPVTVLSPPRSAQTSRGERSRSPGVPAASVAPATSAAPVPTAAADAWDTAPPGLTRREAAGGHYYLASQIRATSGYMRSELVRMRDSHGWLTSEVAWNAFVNRLLNRGLYQSDREVIRAWEIAFGCEALPHFGFLWEHDLERLRRNLPSEAVKTEDLIRF